MDNYKEYVVTLKSYDDLEDFYNEIESAGGTEFIPKRKVDVALRRPMSQNTHYFLTREEVDTLINDPRVLAIAPAPNGIDFEVRPLAMFSKSYQATSGEQNWGLYRCFSGEHAPGWGEDESPQLSISNDFLKIFPEGEDVDVVISDGIINPDHPEMKLNADGTGPSRVIQYNWFQHNIEVAGTGPSNYVYDYNNPDPNTAQDNNHGMHVAGTVCGNRQGWAKKANVYNISPYRDNIALHFDYIRAFHKAKPINPKTGRKNPTIVNCSWGFFNTFFGKMQSVVYRNQTFNNVQDFTLSYLQNNFHIPCWKPSSIFEIVNNQPVIRPPAVDEVAVDTGVLDMGVETSIIQAINEGIIIVGAAGNLNIYASNLGDNDWDNRICFQSNNPWPSCRYFSRGGTPGSSFDWSRNGIPNVICVGAADSLSIEERAYYSHIGPRVDVFAPGTWILSSINSTSSPGNLNITTDERDPVYYLEKQIGTSMASPQVCGILACMLSKYPSMDQWTARQLLEQKLTKKDQLVVGNNYYNKMPNTKNLYLYFSREIPTEGIKFPNNNMFIRANNGTLYPRIKNKFFK